MFGIVKDWFEKLILWIDWPPPKPRPGIRYVHWEFLGDILDDLATLTDREIEEFSRRDFSSPDDIRELIRLWILPDFHRYTPASKEKIRNTLDFYLATRSEKLEWVFPSFAIPVKAHSAFLFYSLVREALYREPLPSAIDSRQYEECERPSFINSLEKMPEFPDGGEKPRPLPERKGLNLPARLDRHHADMSLEPSALKDAVRWKTSVDHDFIRQTACERYQKRKENGTVSSRLTFHFSRIVGEGYTSEKPDTLVKTRKARFLFDKLGFLIDCYPVIR